MAAPNGSSPPYLRWEYTSTPSIPSSAAEGMSLLPPLDESAPDVESWRSGARPAMDMTTPSTPDISAQLGSSFENIALSSPTLSSPTLSSPTLSSPTLSSAEDPEPSPMEPPHPLRPEVEELIQPWREADSKPPFTNAQLIVFAFFMQQQSTLTRTALYSWITDTFRYYNDERSIIDKEVELRFGGSGCIPRFCDALDEFDLPIETRLSHPWPEPTDVFFTISWPAARIFLDLEPKRTGVFHFMELPREIRDKIYRMLLVYPKDSVLESSKNRLKACSSVRRVELDDLSDPDSVDEHVSLFLPHPDQALSVFSVSKTLYSEAAPIYYGENKFGSSCLIDLEYELHGMGRNVRQRIRHLRPTISVPITEHLSHLATMLQDMSLTTLEIKCEKLWFLPITRRGFDELVDFGEFVSLARRARVLSVSGCDLFETWLLQKVAEEAVEEDGSKSPGEVASDA